MNQATRLQATNSFRRARFMHFLALVSTIPRTDRPLRILDIGGRPEYWADKRGLINRECEITILNREVVDQVDGFVFVSGDARSMPQYAENSFDVVHSNSVIEHVGSYEDMMNMAHEVRRVAPAYFVQTPYFWFPIEPHAQTPLLHWLPESWRWRVVKARKCGPVWNKATSVHDAMGMIQSSNLLDKAMFAALFPDAKIVPEKFYGLIKSLMAIRTQ